MIFNQAVRAFDYLLCLQETPKFSLSQLRRSFPLMRSFHRSDSILQSSAKRELDSISNDQSRPSANKLQMQGFRPTVVAWPNKDLLATDVRIKVREPSNSIEWHSGVSHISSLIDLIQKETRLARPLFDIVESAINGVFELYANVEYAKVLFHGPPQEDRLACIMKLSKYSNGLKSDVVHQSPEHFMCGVTTTWQFEAIMDGQQCQQYVKIHTRENRGINSNEANGVMSNDDLPQRGRDGASKHNWYHPMLHIHENLKNQIKFLPQPCSEPTYSGLAKLAFQLADNVPNGNRLQEILIRSEFRANEAGSKSINARRATALLLRAQYHDQLEQPHAEDLSPSTEHHAYIALGSNMGDPITMIESACREMNRQGIQIDRTSALYETKPMYYHDQPPFVNGVCEIKTTFEPFDLLQKVQEVEIALGRQKSFKNGPRSIDLDILLYDCAHIDHERLCLPHKRIQEREFVLRPLCDLIPDNILSPSLPTTIRTLLSRLPQPLVPLSPLTPLAPNIPPVLSRSSSRATRIMAILNLTPDSFSDGGQQATEPSLLLPTLEHFLSAGVSLIDIGGQSTRPRALPITANEELSRVLPTIKFIRSNSAFDKIAISIDTYRASVANAAISAGANIVNDVSAGQMDSEMLPTIAKLGCTVILMHMRGTPATMTQLTHYPSGLVKEVGAELLERVSQAEKAGIRRWRMILDPGIGFAKTAAQNLELLRRLGDLRDSIGLHGLPWAVGVSRKQFIGRITGVEKPSERSWGTASAVTAAIQGGADIVRVHDTVEMAQVVKMADSIWRVESQSTSTSNSGIDGNTGSDHETDNSRSEEW